MPRHPKRGPEDHRNNDKTSRNHKMNESTRPEKNEPNNYANPNESKTLKLATGGEGPKREPPNVKTPKRGQEDQRNWDKMPKQNKMNEATLSVRDGPNKGPNQKTTEKTQKAQRSSKKKPRN